MSDAKARSGAYVLGPGEGSRTAFLGHEMLFKASAANTGTMSVLEIEQHREGEPPLHVHHREDEAFYVLDGEMTFFVGGERLPAPAGSFVFLPREVPHGFTVDGSGVARVLQLCFPPGFERFFVEWGDRPLDVPQMSAALAEYGVDVVGPPPRVSAGAG